MGTQVQAKRGIFYGWWIVAAGAVIFGLGFLIQYFGTIFSILLVADFKWTKVIFGNLISVTTFLALAWGLLAGFLTDRLGPKRVMMIGAALVIIGVALFTTNHSTALAFIYLPVIISMGAAFQIGVPVQTLARRWFMRRAGLALGIIFATFGLAAAISIAPATQLAIQYGWRPTVLVMTIIFEIIMFLLTVFVVKDTPESMKLHIDGLSDEQAKAFMGVVGQTLATEPHLTRGQALRTSQFWIFAIAVAFVSVAYMGYFSHAALIGASVGMPAASAAAQTIGVWAVATIPGYLGGGFVRDKLGNRRTLVLFAILSTLAYLYAWLFVKTPTTLLIFMALAGLLNSPVVVTIPAFLGDLFGRLHLGSIMGICVTVMGVGSALGPTVAGVIADKTGSYTLLYLLGFLANFVFIPLIFLIKRSKVEEHFIAQRAAQKAAASH
jgi:MFS family permease